MKLQKYVLIIPYFRIISWSHLTERNSPKSMGLQWTWRTAQRGLRVWQEDRLQYYRQRTTVWLLPAATCRITGWRVTTEGKQQQQ